VTGVGAVVNVLLNMAGRLLPDRSFVFVLTTIVYVVPYDSPRLKVSDVPSGANEALVVTRVDPLNTATLLAFSVATLIGSENVTVTGL
jgi:hypothetical protein